MVVPTPIDLPELHFIRGLLLRAISTRVLGQVLRKLVTLGRVVLHVIPRIVACSCGGSPAIARLAFMRVMLMGAFLNFLVFASHSCLVVVDEV